MLEQGPHLKLVPKAERLVEYLQSNKTEIFKYEYIRKYNTFYQILTRSHGQKRRFDTMFVRLHLVRREAMIPQVVSVIA